MTVKYITLEARNFSYKIGYAIRWTFGYLNRAKEGGEMQSRKCKGSGAGWYSSDASVFKASKITISLFCKQ